MKISSLSQPKYRIEKNDLQSKNNIISVDLSKESKENSENYISNLIDVINDNNLNVFYDEKDIEESNFKHNIDQLNLKFYLETEKILNSNQQENQIENQNKLFLILFKQINLYIKELERLNMIILKQSKDPNSLKKRMTIISQQKDDFETKELMIQTLKHSNKSLEKKLSQLMLSENKFREENEKLKKKIKFYEEKFGNNFYSNDQDKTKMLYSDNSNNEESKSHNSQKSSNNINSNDLINVSQSQNNFKRRTLSDNQAGFSNMLNLDKNNNNVINSEKSKNITSINSKNSFQKCKNNSNKNYLNISGTKFILKKNGEKTIHKLKIKQLKNKFSTSPKIISNKMNSNNINNKYYSNNNLKSSFTNAFVNNNNNNNISNNISCLNHIYNGQNKNKNINEVSPSQSFSPNRDLEKSLNNNNNYFNSTFHNTNNNNKVYINLMGKNLKESPKNLKTKCKLLNSNDDINNCCYNNYKEVFIDFSNSSFKIEDNNSSNNLLDDTKGIDKEIQDLIKFENLLIELKNYFNKTLSTSKSRNNLNNNKQDKKKIFSEIQNISIDLAKNEDTSFQTPFISNSKEKNLHMKVEQHLKKTSNGGNY